MYTIPSQHAALLRASQLATAGIQGAEQLGPEDLCQTLPKLGSAMSCWYRVYEPVVLRLKPIRALKGTSTGPAASEPTLGFAAGGE